MPNTSALTTGQRWNVFGTGTYAAGAYVPGPYDGVQQITVIDATHVDLVGSTFSVTVTTGGLWGPQIEPTAAQLNADINNVNCALPNPTFYAPTQFTIDTALTNPLATWNIFSVNANAIKLKLPQANLFGSPCIGVSFLITNNGGNYFWISTASGVNQFKSFPGMALRIALKANNSSDGTWADDWAVPNAGAVIQSPSAAGQLPISASTFATDGTWYSTALSGDCTIAGTGAITCIQLNGVSPGTLFALNLSSNLAFTGNDSFAGSFTLSGRTDATIAADQNDWTPSGTGTYANSSEVFVDGGAADRNVTGLTGGAAGRIVGIVNKGTTNNIVIKNQSGSSAAANRFLLPADVVLPPNTALVLRYDGTASVWRPWGRALANTGVTAATYGSATQSAQCTFGIDGRATSCTNITIAPPFSAITGTATVAQGGTGDTGTAWTAYTPTVTCATGVPTTFTATGRYKTLGKTTWIYVNVNITALGACAGDIFATLPGTAANQNTPLATIDFSTGAAGIAYANTGGKVDFFNAVGAAANNYSASGTYEAQ
jgi:hypothetical protein